MAFKFHTIKPVIRKKKRKTIGRGNGSGHGSYSTQGIKGQKARSGVGGLKLKGMKHIILSTPKLRGFTSIHKKTRALNLTDIDKHYKNGETVDINTLFEKKLVKNTRSKVKIIASGKLLKSLIVKGCQVSGGAKTAIESAGGRVE